MKLACLCKQVVWAVVGTYQHALALKNHLGKPELTIKAISKSYFIIPKSTATTKEDARFHFFWGGGWSHSHFAQGGKQETAIP